jgi:hypothetical protein
MVSIINDENPIIHWAYFHLGSLRSLWLWKSFINDMKKQHCVSVWIFWEAGTKVGLNVQETYGMSMSMCKGQMEEQREENRSAQEGASKACRSAPGKENGKNRQEETQTMLWAENVAAWLMGCQSLSRSPVKEVLYLLSMGVHQSPPSCSLGWDGPDGCRIHRGFRWRPLANWASVANALAVWSWPTLFILKKLYDFSLWR